MAYRLPYSGVFECDEAWLTCIGRKIRGVVGIPSIDMLIIIMVKIMFSIVGLET